MSEKEELNKKWAELVKSDTYGTVWAGSAGMSKFPNNGTSVTDAREIVKQPAMVGNSFSAGPTANFGTIVKIEPCTRNECANGHKWPAQLALAGCPGCGATVLMWRMVNCPLCNEPCVKGVLRSDFTNQGFGIAAICRGQVGAAECVEIELHRHAHEEVMEKWNAETGRMR